MAGGGNGGGSELKEEVELLNDEVDDDLGVNADDEKIEDEDDEVEVATGDTVVAVMFSCSSSNN